MNSYSQAKQDLFVLEQTQYKKNGTFLDIGCAQPIEINNTYLLETQYNWNGVSIDIEDYSKKWESRNTKFINHDALTLDYENILKDICLYNRIDYLSLDLEPPTLTFQMLNILPLSKYRFSVITYEHDFYRGYSELREQSRKILINYCYILLKQDVGKENGHPAEDWYIDGILL